jgi:hypothetical protein
MLFNNVDIESIEKVVYALATGLKRAEAETADGRRFVGYYIKDNQVRIDIVESVIK